MQLLFVNDIMRQIVSATYWTLIHSIWIGMLLTIATGIAISFTKASRSATRYRILSALFFSFMLAIVATFMYQLANSTANQTAAIGAISITEQELIALDKQVLNIQHPFIHNLTEFLNRNAYPIFLVWLLILLAKGIKLGLNLRYINRLRIEQTETLPDYWNQRFIELAATLRLNQSIILLESHLVTVPVVLGYLKPLVLLPVGLVSNIPAEQVEAILLHELAHIKRQDYLMNIIQNIMEMIFFFNPAVLWLSNLLRDERESCCDEMAIGVTNDKARFIRALISFQEERTAGKSYALNFPGNKNQLLTRVKRIIHNENKKLNAMEKGIVIASIVTIGVLGLLSKTPAQAQVVERQRSVRTETGSKDTIPSGKGEIREERKFHSVSQNMKDSAGLRKNDVSITDQNGDRYNFTLINDKMTNLVVNGKVIDASDYPKYDYIVEDLKKRIEEKKRRAAEQKIVLRERQEKMQQQQLELQKQKEKMMEARQEKVAEVREKKVLELKMREAEQDAKILKLKLKEANQEPDRENKELNEKILKLQNQRLEAEKEYQSKQQELEKDIRLKIEKITKEQIELSNQNQKELRIRQSDIIKKIESHDKELREERLKEIKLKQEEIDKKSKQLQQEQVENFNAARLLHLEKKLALSNDPVLRQNSLSLMKQRLLVEPALKLKPTQFQKQQLDLKRKNFLRQHENKMKLYQQKKHPYLNEKKKISVDVDNGETEDLAIAK